MSPEPSGAFAPHISSKQFLVGFVVDLYPPLKKDRAIEIPRGSETTQGVRHQRGSNDSTYVSFVEGYC